MKKYLTFLFFLPVIALLYFYAAFYHQVKPSPQLEPKPMEHTMSLLFMGDIMGHKSQISAAFDPKSQSYQYDSTFYKIAPIIKAYDFALANLEVTLSGPPYRGYPSFSSPNSLAQAAKKGGIDVCFIANNHACDKGSKGIKRTIKALDALNIRHTGTFIKISDRNQSNLVILEKETIRVGLLNYTEHTNCVLTPKGLYVNRLELPLILRDINQSRSKKLDKLVLMLHWGSEYQSLPQKKQIAMAEKLFAAGADIIIGAHPHVIQPMHYFKESNTTKEKLIYYSLGNFVSDQHRYYTDGGGMAALVLAKKNGKTIIKKHGYHLIWVNKYLKSGQKAFEVLLVKNYEQNRHYLSLFAQKKMDAFTTYTRNLLKQYNIDVKEW